MKKRVSISISLDILQEIDRQIGPTGSRSAFIEKALLDHMRDLEWQAFQHRDLELINANADALNREALDVLRYQAVIFADEPSPK
jgi:metal-responsive CopG/Arc/MetJ family transcriptional regulator